MRVRHLYVKEPSTPMRLSAVILQRLACLLCITLVSCVTGCSNHAQRIRTAREHFYAGNMGPADEALSEYIEQHPDDADATALDLAMVQLFDGRPAEAESTLRRVRDNLDHFEQTDLLNGCTAPPHPFLERP